MAGLIFFVARAGVIDVGEAVEGEFAIAFEPLRRRAAVDFPVGLVARVRAHGIDQAAAAGDLLKDRKSTRLNSSHVSISYAVFCLKKKNKDSIVEAINVT